MSLTLSPTPSRVRRKPSSARRPPVQAQESHGLALNAIRSFLKGRTCYDAFPVSWRLIVLDTRLNVKKALQSLLYNGTFSTSLPLHRRHRPRSLAGIVSAPLWNSEQCRFSGMLTVLDIIHLIQYYYQNASYDSATADVETF